MKIRIQKNLFTGEYSDHLFKGSACIGELLDQYQCSPESQVFLNGEMVTDLHTIADDGSFVVVKEVPKGVTALIVTSIVLGVAGVVLGGVALYKALTANPSLPNIQTSPSLRGSTNSARKGERLPILLGHWRIYPDHAALPYSRYADNNQFFVQQFCFGYSDVSLDMDTAKIGDTLISKYTGVQTSLTPSTLYAARVIESQIGVELANDGTATPIERTTSSGTTKINVGVIAPSGIYKYNGSDKESTVIGVKIEWRIPDGTWNVFADESLTLNVSKWRKMYEITPSGSADGTYDIRVSRTNKAGSTTSYNDTIYLDVLQSFTKNQNNDSTIPVLNSSNLRLLAVDIKATDQLNGTIDSFNVEGTLSTRVWDGVDTGAAHWTTAATRNPAAAILYLLTNSKVNPRPIADTQIVWEEFEEFYQYCEDQGFHCDAWITGDYTIGQLIDLIAQSNMAEIRRSADSVGIIIDKINPYIAQMFTPLNAADFSMKKDFSLPTQVLNLKFVDASIGYEESERNVSIVNDSIVFDRVLTDEDESTEITLFSVTDPAHVAKVGRYRLLEIARRKRTFSWSCDIEGILCTRGDVVLLSNDKFLLGTGEGRVSVVIRNTEGLITAIELDSEIDMVVGNYYGIRIRTIDHILGSYEIVNAECSKRLLQLKTPIDETIVIGDLVAVGVLQRENLKVLITEITQDTNRVCKISGIEYAEEIYTDGTVIPAYQSGLSIVKSGHGISTKIINEKFPAGGGTPPRSKAYRGYSTVTPDDAIDGDTFLYTGTTTPERTQYHYYRYSSASASWLETQDSVTVVAGWKDALAISSATGTTIFAALLIVELLVAKNLEVLSDSGNRHISIGDAGILAKDTNGTIIHDLPNASILTDNSYLGHVLWFQDQATYKIYDVTNFPINTWTDVTCLTAGSSNVKAGIFKVYLNSDNNNNGVSEPFNFVWLRPKGSSWVASATSNTPEGRLYIEDRSSGIDSTASVYFLICPIGADNKIQFNANAQPSGNYKRIVINQLGVLI